MGSHSASGWFQPPRGAHAPHAAPVPRYRRRDVPNEGPRALQSTCASAYEHRTSAPVQCAHGAWPILLALCRSVSLSIDGVAHELLNALECIAGRTWSRCLDNQRSGESRLCEGRSVQYIDDAMSLLSHSAYSPAQIDRARHVEHGPCSHLFIFHVADCIWMPPTVMTTGASGLIPELQLVSFVVRNTMYHKQGVEGTVVVAALSSPGLLPHRRLHPRRRPPYRNLLTAA